MQQQGELFDDFVTDLKLLVQDCGYKDGKFQEEMVRDLIVFGVASSKTRERLIEEGDTLTLDEAIRIAKTHEFERQQLKSMGDT